MVFISSKAVFGLAIHIQGEKGDATRGSISLSGSKREGGRVCCLLLDNPLHLIFFCHHRVVRLPEEIPVAILRQESKTEPETAHSTIGSLSRGDFQLP
jgi:hypothetical protein